jgi:hypothetical protein
MRGTRRNEKSRTTIEVSMTRFSRLVATAAATAAVTIAFTALTTAQVGTGTIALTAMPINNGAGNQSNPHVGGEIVTYSNELNGSNDIHYFNTATGVDAAISNALPGQTATDILPDVNGGTIVFTRLTTVSSAVMVFDVNAGGPAIEIDPQPSSRRNGAVIGGSTVAWVDKGLNVPAEIVVYDLNLATATRLTNDGAVDQSLAVSPDGNVVVWEKCSAGNCDIYQAVKFAGVWTVTQVTNTPEDEALPDTNGTVVVYGSNRAGSATDADIYWTNVTGGVEHQLAIAGVQQNANISGSIVTFESQATVTDPEDLFAYDLSTNTLYNLTNTPALSETLNDVSILPNGTVRGRVCQVVEKCERVMSRL